MAEIYQDVGIFGGFVFVVSIILVFIVLAIRGGIDVARMLKSKKLDKEIAEMTKEYLHETG